MAPRSGSSDKAAPAPKRLIVVRHGHRSKAEGRERDNGLSKKGRRQAQKVADHFRTVFPGAVPLILSSAKARCAETVEPLAKVLKTKVKLSPLLMEQGGVPGEGERPESDAKFEARLREFHRWWREEAPPLSLVCSHGDWIPLALKVMTGTTTDLKKGGWAEVVDENGVAKLEWLRQTLGDEEND